MIDKSKCVCWCATWPMIVLVAVGGTGTGRHCCCVTNPLAVNETLRRSNSPSHQPITLFTAIGYMLDKVFLEKIVPLQRYQWYNLNEVNHSRMVYNEDDEVSFAVWVASLPLIFVELCSFFSMSGMATDERRERFRNVLVTEELTHIRD